MQKQIYYHDTDAGGVVYYARYLEYLEEARTEYLEKKGLNIVSIKKQGFLYAVKDCYINYKSPARYGDKILCDAKLSKITAVQMVFDQTITHANTQEILVEAKVTLVSLNKDFKPTPIPQSIRDLLTA